MKLNEDFLARMREASELLRSAGPAAATAAIQRALGGAGADTDSGHAYPDAAGAGQDMPSRADRPARGFKAGWAGMRAAQAVEDAEIIDEPGTAQAPGARGSFLHGTYANSAGKRAYRLYIPAGEKAPRPLVVMLHGCKQNPEDFAAGTGMNALADKHNFIVLYPAQAQNANGSSCWNWFKDGDQRRDGGEPSIIAGMTRKLMAEHGADPQRVYVAGLSAGGAMASILAAAYPDLYAAVGVHSGLPVGAAHDVPSAFAAMNSGKAKALHPYPQPVPVIVFHGDRDHTVHPSNGSDVLVQCMGAPRDQAGPDGGRSRKTSTKGKSAHGRRYTRTCYLDDDQRTAGEHWLIHGSGHAWSGGRKAGSYTDAQGPDASAEMIRFFLDHPKR